MDRIQGVCELGWEHFYIFIVTNLQLKLSISCYYECKQWTSDILAVSLICH